MPAKKPLRALAKRAIKIKTKGRDTTIPIPSGRPTTKGGSKGRPTITVNLTLGAIVTVIPRFNAFTMMLAHQIAADLYAVAHPQTWANINGRLNPPGGLAKIEIGHGDHLMTCTAIIIRTDPSTPTPNLASIATIITNSALQHCAATTPHDVVVVDHITTA